MRAIVIPEEDIKGLNKRYLAGASLAGIVGDYGISSSTAVNYFKRMGLPYPRPKAAAQHELPKAADSVTLVTEPEPITEDAPAMDDPEMMARQEEPTAAANEDLARAHARKLHAKTSMVIAVQPLSDIPSVLARKQPYDAPLVLESGSVLEMAHPQAAVKLVEKLVASLNQAGVQAYFEWRAEGQTGRPLAR